MRHLPGFLPANLHVSRDLKNVALAGGSQLQLYAKENFHE